MNLEINLVGTPNYPSKDVVFIARNRVSVKNDTEALDAIVRFIQDNKSEFTARVNQKLSSQLDTLKSLTIDQFSCLRSVLTFSGLDIIPFYVSNNEVNTSEVPLASIETNVLDRNNINGNFLPFCTKITQLRDEYKFTRVVMDVVNMFGLFKSSFFDGIPNIVENNINQLKGMEETKVNQPSVIAEAIIRESFNLMNKDFINIRS